MNSRVSAAIGQPGPAEARLPYLPGLDGLRALAVIAVLLYHGEVGVFGGFLGVESFFVLSGYLITGLLLAEWRQRGRIDLAAFWLRRARRLLPALFLMLICTLVIAHMLLGDESSDLRGDTAAALGYVMNWRLVFSGQTYFDPMVRPSLLQHLWSLAVEEQFYLLWPVLFVIGMRYVRAGGLLIATLMGAAASAALMAWLYQPGADPSRIYYGTDTRAAGLLLGAALAMIWAPWHAPMAAKATAKCSESTKVTKATKIGKTYLKRIFMFFVSFVGREIPVLARWALDIAGAGALAGLAAAYIWLTEHHPLLYHGGLSLVTIGTGIVIAAATHPRARLVPGALSWRPLRWIGVRSYGIYLWHWPIFMVTRPYVDVPLDGWLLLALRLAIVVGLAELSYRLVELPVRHGALERAWRACWATRRARPRPRRTPFMRWGPPRVPILLMILLFSAACAVPVSTRPQATPALTAGASPPAPGPTKPAAITAADTATVARAPDTTVPAATAAPSPSATTVATAADTPSALPAPSPSAAPTEVALGPFDPALGAKLQAILDETVADGHIPGATLAVNLPGQATWTGASGLADRRQGQPMTPATHARIASISKIFTAVVVLQLIEEGLIDLDAPMTTWLPDLVPKGENITVRNLLQHTSGLYDYLEDRNFVNRAYKEPTRVWTPRELVEYAVRFPPSFKPGAKGAWDYSSTNYVILGMIVERATGNTMAHEVRARILDPLELRQTFFQPDEAVEGIQAHGYSNNVDQTNAPMSFVFATANIVSTAENVQRFARALLGGELLKAETLGAMLTFVNGKGQYNMPKLEYGLGIMRNQLPVGKGPDGQPRPPEASTVLGHIGGYGGFRSAVWSAPESGITIALGVNQAATDPNKLATKVFDAILTAQGR